MDDDPDELEERLLYVEYEHWRQNAGFLYDLQLMHTLQWPSLTVQWLPGRQRDPDDNFSTQQCLLGTHTSGTDTDYVIIADVAIPEAPLQASQGGGASQQQPPASGTTPDHMFENLGEPIVISMLIRHEGEVNKARYMPLQQHQQPPLEQQQQPASSFVIATKSVSAEVYVFDTRHYANQADGDTPLEQECRPDLRLTGHTCEGYGLSWSVLQQGHVLSGSNDQLVCTWDVQGMPERGRVLPALRTYQGHKQEVEDVSWHPFNQHVFGSVGDDKQLILWDTRKPAHKGVLRAVEAHSREVNGLDFSPFNPHLLATCSSDTTVALRDWRALDQPLHVLEGHTDDVYQLSWSPQHPTLLASSGLDRRLLVWDISRIGAEQDPDDPNDADDGPPELLFCHAGQVNKLNDFGWSCNEPLVVAGVSDRTRPPEEVDVPRHQNNVLQVWRMADSIHSKASRREAG